MVLALLATTAAASLLGACGQTGSKTGADTTVPVASLTPARESRTIVVALAQAPLSLDPADHRDRQSETVIRNVFDGLVTRDTRNRVHLELAREMRWLDDQTLKIWLHQGVLFHDGAEMTADDVVFSFNRIIQADAIEYPVPHSSPRQGLITPLESIEKIDDYTVKITTPEPNVLFLSVVFDAWAMIPPGYFEEVGQEGFNEHPIGTGPYKFVEWVKGDHITM